MQAEYQGSINPDRKSYEVGSPMETTAFCMVWSEFINISSVEPVHDKPRNFGLLNANFVVWCT